MCCLCRPTRASRPWKANSLEWFWKYFFFSPDGCLPADVPEIVSAVSEPFLRGGFLCFEESVRKERGRGEQEECMCCPFWPQISPKSQKCDGQYRRTPVSCVVITRFRRLLPFRSPPTQSWVQNSAPPLGKLVHWNYSTGKRVNRFLSGSCKDTGPPKSPLLGYGKTPPSEEAAGGSLLSC